MLWLYLWGVPPIVMMGFLQNVSAIPLALVIGILLMCQQAVAAEFRVLPGDADTPALVIVAGEFAPGDNEEFVRQVVSLRDAVVVFSSPGGNLETGLEIGKAIRLKNFITYVPADTFCASACGLAWLGGTQRFMSKTAKIGFHAAYNASSGFARESGMANAVVGAYLNSLGLPNQAVMYMTMAGPDSMAWLTPQDAVSLGLNVQVYDLGEPSQPSGPVTAQPAPGPQTAPPPPAAQPPQASVANEETRRVQQCLYGFRYYRGPINGLLDEETSYSIQKFQQAWGMRVTGSPTYELLNKCGIPIE